jgi:predicted nucleic acid-binding protein
MKTLTFLDASVLIYAASKPTDPTLALRFRALRLLAEPEREFAASTFLKLELLPVPTFYRKTRELKFYHRFFSSIAIWADHLTLPDTAHEIACRYGLNALDALHIAAAQQVDAEFITAERPTKPIYRAYKNVSSIYQ